MEIAIKAIIIIIVFVLLMLSLALSRRAEQKMQGGRFTVKQMLLLPISSFALLGMGVFVYVIILVTNLNKGSSLAELSENDSIGVMLGTIFTVIGGFLVYISLRWRIVISGDELTYIPFLGKPQKMKLKELKYIRATKLSPGFSAYNREGKKLFTVDGFCRGYVPLVIEIWPYIDNPSDIPQPEGPVR